MVKSLLSRLLPVALLSIAILCVSGCVSVCAHTLEVDMIYKSLGVSQGLSNNVVRDVAQDKFGYIWIATDEGLNRISGTRINYRFKTGINGDWLSGNELNSLADDPENSVMWIGTQRSGLIAYNYDTGEYRNYRSWDSGDDVLSTDDVTDLEFDKNGRLLIATFWHGVDCLDPKTGKFTHYNMDTLEGMSSNQVLCVAQAENEDIIYVGHERGGFSVIDTGSMTVRNFTTEDGLPGNSVHSILVEDNHVWLGTDKGMCLYRSNSSDFINYDLGHYNTLCSDIIDMDGRLWLAMEYHGVVEFDRKNHVFNQIIPYYFDGEAGDISLPSSSPSVFFEDSFHNVWIGTYRNGLIVLSPETGRFSVDNHFFRESNTGFYNSVADVMSIAIARDVLYCGTNGSGLISDNIRVMENPQIFPDHIQTVACDKDGILWCGDNIGVVTRYDPVSNKVSRYDLEVEPEGIKDLYPDGDLLWAGTNKGLIRFDKRKGEVSGRYSVGNDFIRKIEKDSYGHLLVGTFGEGLRVFDEYMNEIDSLRVISGFPSNTVNDICVDPHHVWVATSEGLVEINAKDYRDFKVVAQPYRNIYSVIRDKNGNIWFSTLTGIGVVRKDGTEVFFNNNLPLKSFNTNSVAGGVDGRLYFGTTSGIVTFMPDYVLDENNVSSPAISELFVYSGNPENTNRYVNLRGKKTVTLDHSENSFTIYVNPLNYFDQRIEYECRLSGFEDRWYDMDKSDKVTYRNLPYGSYEFQVREKSHSKEHVYKPVILHIRINPPFWLSWWAKLLYVIIGCCGLWYLIRRYEKHLRKKSDAILEKRQHANQQELNEERLKFFTNITHELRTPLTLIVGPLEDIMRSKSINEPEKRKLSMISNSAHRLLELVNQILDFRKTETRNKRLCVGKGNIAETIFEVGLKYRELQRKDDVEVSITADPEKIYMYYDREVITTIVDNLMSNALKYTDSGRIVLSVSLKEIDGKEKVCLRVSDTGYGISQESLPYIFDRYYQEKGDHQASGTGIGLALVKALVSLHQGEIEVESERNKGTVFSIIFDKDNVYPDALHTDDSDANPHESLSVDVDHDLSAMERGDKSIVLLVEDNPDIIEYVRDYMSDMFDVRTATNGKEGLEVARRVLPDVIVTDIMMPVMNGLEFCRILKNDVATSHIPVVILTAKDSVSDREQGYDIGAESYLTKPFSASLLVKRINNLISRRDNEARYYAMTHDPAHNSDNGQVNLCEPGDDSSGKVKQFADAMSQIDKEFLERIRNIIIENLCADKFDIDYVADAVCMSRATLYRKMKAVAGMSTNDYIRKIRMEAAENLILEGGLPISEIAFKVGYNSLSYFRESFKAVYGKTPTEYIKWLKSENKLEWEG